jgi:hypothetical protein
LCPGLCTPFQEEKISYNARVAGACDDGLKNPHNKFWILPFYKDSSSGFYVRSNLPADFLNVYEAGGRFPLN